MQTEMVKVEWILQNVTRSCDGFNLSTAEGWAAMLNRKLADCQVPALLESILEYGFNTPVQIVIDHSGIYRQENGHHRLALAIALCLDEIPALIANISDGHPAYRYSIGQPNEYLSSYSDLTELGKAARELWQPLFEQMYW